MKVTPVEFLTSQTKYAEINKLPQIAVVGRSNAGKSSLLNMLAGARIAKTSSTPGRTRLINHFKFGDSFVLIDLPGYGYAAGPKKEKVDWGSMIEGYFAASELLKHVLVLMDIRHEPSAQDIQMLQFLYARHIPFTVIATKADKLSKAKRAAAVHIICKATSLGRDNVIVSSATENIGREEIYLTIKGVLG